LQGRALQGRALQGRALQGRALLLDGGGRRRGRLDATGPQSHAERHVADMETHHVRFSLVIVKRGPTRVDNQSWNSRQSCSKTGRDIMTSRRLHENLMSGMPNVTLGQRGVAQTRTPRWT